MECKECGIYYKLFHETSDYDDAKKHGYNKDQNEWDELVSSFGSALFVPLEGEKGEWFISVDTFEWEPVENLTELIDEQDVCVKHTEQFKEILIRSR